MAPDEKGITIAAERLDGRYATPRIRSELMSGPYRAQGPTRCPQSVDGSRDLPGLSAEDVGFYRSQSTPQLEQYAAGVCGRRAASTRIAEISLCGSANTNCSTLPPAPRTTRATSVWFVNRSYVTTESRPDNHQ